MTIPSILRHYLAGTGGQFNLRTVPPTGTVVETAVVAGIPLEKLARAVMLKSGTSSLMVIVSGEQEPDLYQIERLFKRDFELCSAEESAALCTGCDADWLTPLPEAFGLKAIVDKGLNGLDEIFFPAGIPGQFIRSSSATYFSMLQDAWRDRGVALARAEATSAEVYAISDLYRQKVQAVKKLPAMPGIAAEIIRVRDNPYSQANELAAVIEQDPSLSAQLIRHATSPLYGYQGNVESVEQAIVRVLGMDFVTDFAFGLAVGKTFRNPKSGPIGLNAYWHHALHAASLTQALCNGIEYSRRPAPGLAYLAGLLHNLGFLLLGHLFPAQFERLNRAIELHPERPVTELERDELGISHTDMGLWLMEAWDMPQEVAAAVQHHHDDSFRGDYAVYANLVTIANTLLKRHGIGDADSLVVAGELLEAVGLDLPQAEVALATVMEGTEGISFTASKMAA